jgi:hypothetical protein
MRAGRAPHVGQARVLAARGANTPGLRARLQPPRLQRGAGDDVIAQHGQQRRGLGGRQQLGRGVEAEQAREVGKALA